MSQEPLWYYLEQGQVIGPVSAVQLRQMAKAGQLTPQTQVCRQGTQDWMEAARLRMEFRGPAMPASAAPAPAAVQPAVAPQGYAPTPDPAGYGTLPTDPRQALAMARSIGGEHNLFNPRWMLDFRFEKFVTPQIVQVIWLVWIVLTGLSVVSSTLFTLYVVIRAIRFPEVWIISLLYLLLSLLGTLLATLFVRVVLEFLINMFHLARQPR